MSTIIESPDAGGLEKDGASIVQQANALAVSNAIEHGVAATFLQRVAAGEKAVKELFAEPKKKAHEAHKALTQAEGKLLIPLGSARLIATTKIINYQDEQQKIAQAKAAALALEMRKREEEAVLAEAVDAEARGDKVEAAEILAQEIQAPVVTVAPAFTPVDGVSGRGTWSALVTEFKDLVAYVAAHPEWMNLLLPNEVALNNLARAQKKALALPGVRAVEKRGLAVRA